jgi:hypothetical protein
MEKSAKTDAKQPGELRVNLRKGTGASTSVTLNNVQVEVSTPSAAQLKQGLLASKRVAAALSELLPRKGVRLNIPKTVPSYSADPKDSEYVIRKIGDTKTRGRFTRDGRFVAVKS